MSRFSFLNAERRLRISDFSFSLFSSRCSFSGFSGFQCFRIFSQLPALRLLNSPTPSTSPAHGHTSWAIAKQSGAGWYDCNPGTNNWPLCWLGVGVGFIDKKALISWANIHSIIWFNMIFLCELVELMVTNIEWFRCVVFDSFHMKKKGWFVFSWVNIDIAIPVLC